MKTKVFLISFILIVFSACDLKKNTLVFHKSKYPKNANAPFSTAVEAGNFIFLAGQIGINHETRLVVPGGVQAETKQAILNIQDVLKDRGLTLDDVVKCTVILADINDFSAFNEVYKTYFTKKPARTTFAASALALNAKIEIDVIAVKP